MAEALNLMQEMEDSVVGCEHYKRTCKFVTPCCIKIYTCRICHDSQEDHVLERNEIATLICSMCAQEQSVAACCCNCFIPFGRYVCLICKMFDHEDKGQFHCQDCGLCRIGGKENYFHCPVCNLCLPLRLRNNHTCLENCSRNNCPVCLEDLHTSRIAAHVSACGHLLHKTCYEDLRRAGRNACPVCQVDY